ncbi:TauD/TfdA family dioxygenase [Candidatus Poriferisocius sp.]|uniref:TauD/TfdA family dioxygenase n=1 Tax=Candidatus Poriferisocius sp. TaxID=3101276 RepID=UPI003B5BAE35
MAGPLTPDFYRYEWHPLSGVRLDGEFVVAGWADGAELRCFRWWLAEHRDVEPSSREGLLEPCDLGEHWRVADAWVEADGAMGVRWAHDGVLSRYHPGWLRHIADGQHLPSSFLPSPIPWDAATLPEPVTYHGPTVLADPETFRLWLNDLVAYGLTRLTSLAVDPDELEWVARRVGVLRDSNFGPVWDIEAVPVPTSTAYMSIGLGPHSDFPSLETPPGFQFFHCLDNSCVGGASQMTDGLAVALHLEQHDPDAYEALTTLCWVHHGRGAEVDWRWSGPLIDWGVAGSPITLRTFYPVRTFPDMADEDVPRAYRAVRTLGCLVRDPRFQITYKLSPGDLAVFDNRRVQHAREPFDVSSGRRWFRGCYVNSDDVYSKLRILNRRAKEAEPVPA